MIPEKLKAALDEHVSAEVGAAYLYLAMSADFDSKSLKGFAKWMRLQFQEEMAHALKFVDYMLSRGATIGWKDAKAPASTFGSPLQAFEKTSSTRRASPLASTRSTTSPWRRATFRPSSSSSGS